MNNEIDSNSTALLLFQHNLRLHDNPSLVAAAKHKQLICLYCFDDWQFNTQSALTYCGVQRAQFIWQSLQDLHNNLQEMGQKLYIVKGELNELVTHIQGQIPTLTVYAQCVSARQEHQQLGKLSRKNPCQIMPGNTLLDETHLPFNLSELPQVFTHFRNKVEKSWPLLCPLARPLTLPKPPSLDLTTLDSSPFKHAYKADPRSAMHFVGGESQALQRLNDYIWQTKALQTYKLTRNQLLGPDYSSKFSPWLATGCLSAKQIFQQVKKFELEYGANDSTYWLVFELLWRDYFAFSAQSELRVQGHQTDKYEGYKLHAKQQQAFDSWCMGNTGNAFVDANMRELLHTGFMSNRGRQNVASYLINELNLDWRTGEAWFTQQLIDYDEASNRGNWQYIAGLKSPNGQRHFNIASQTERYDATGAYRRHWLN